MNKDWKRTLIVLIPKINNPKSADSYRPISLCNTVYKIATKILLNRMEGIIPKLISLEQAAFLKGRSLQDHILIANELIHKFRFSKAYKGLVSIKLDMKQAYETMGWPTLKNILKYFEFPDFFSMLILECVQNPTFLILINGTPSKWIKARCGFRQGCPLSPCLFILCSQLLSNAINEKDDFGIRVSSISPRITHLLYADDIIFFAEAKIKNVRTIKGIVNTYCDWTGQKVNTNKTSMLFGKAVNIVKRKKIKRIMGFKEVKEFNYLGSKLSVKRLSKSDFQFMLDKIMKKLNNWGTRFFSLSGKITMAKYVILSIPSFHSTVSLVPKSIIKEVERICHNFIWNKSNENLGMHYVCWKKLCDPYEQGGRGIQSCLSKTGPLRAKLAWKYMKDHDSLLHKYLFPKYGSCWKAENRNKSISTAWKIIKDGSKSLKDIVSWNVSNGHSIDVFEDIWIWDKSLNKWPTFVNTHEIGNDAIKVDCLISDNQWSITDLKKYFGKDLMDLILNININPDLIEDQFELIHMESGRTIT
ncbi:Putative ribonuclease H protein [Dendrobium catenatum]|uniref:Ribonuclease H protein n=1 Tax=Dendrobium catenatum TaxID=906689 RepID=A0A2I0VYJ8_9ASPA|nr:Putative ribonuclease H protein [Dendrobium catenatum]